MSPALMRMWISIASMGFLFVAMILIYLSRYKLKQKILKVFSAIFAYLLLFISGMIIFLVVFSGPTT
ncbi:DUF2768 domain-containing protein [Niallia sp. XMNu-256]|uniref:DUF2768 domain-containing protein n=1 Tax=Niallia sp. XMNu-256 TaxID=3082444 RepID=UPI0030D04A0A